MEKIKIISLKNQRLKKCDCCSRVKDVYFKVMILDYEENDESIFGDLDFCHQCANNLSKILSNTELDNSKTIKTFDLSF